MEFRKEHEMSFVVVSKWAGRCQVCKQSYGIGTRVTKENGKWGHPDCFRKLVVVETTAREMAIASYPVSPIADIDMDYIENEGDYQDEEIPVEPEPEATVKKFIPSAYQLAIFKWIVFGIGNAVVEAVAGSGKTTTSVQAVKYLPLSVAYHTGKITEAEALEIFESGDFDRIKQFDGLMEGLDVGFFAFNKHIAAELGKRLPTWCYSATLHSLGYADLRQSLGNVRVEERDRWDLLFNDYPLLQIPKNIKQYSKEERAKIYTRRDSFKNLVALAKATLLDANIKDEILDMMSYYGIDLEENTDYFISILPLVLEKCKENTNLIDFDDMQWLPIVLNLPLRKFDFLFVDETQDLNNNQTEFVLRSLKSTGRAVCVGDSRQSLYGFRGANVDAMENIVKALSATVLPLSITYRCPASVVRMAQQIVPQIQARENAPEGMIVETSLDVMGTKIAKGDMVVCRTNAPLVPVAFGLIRKGVKATIRGRDIGKNLSELANNIANGCGEMETFFYRLSDYSIREMTRLESRRASETQIQALEDKVDTLRAVAGECDEPMQVAFRIQEIFSDDNGEVVLSSVHRAKGLESNNVWILRPDLMPFPRAKQDWEKQQEMNIKYVAITRSLDTLYLVQDK